MLTFRADIHHFLSPFHLNKGLQNEHEEVAAGGVCSITRARPHELLPPIFSLLLGLDSPLPTLLGSSDSIHHPLGEGTLLPHPGAPAKEGTAYMSCIKSGEE